jgi:hypothetical protein
MLPTASCEATVAGKGMDQPTLHSDSAGRTPAVHKEAAAARSLDIPDLDRAEDDESDKAARRKPPQTSRARAVVEVEVPADSPSGN